MYQAASQIPTMSSNSSTVDVFDEKAASKGQTAQVAEVCVRDDAVLQRALRKVDYHLIPPLAVLYLFSYLDRGSLANASIFGFKEDLGLSTAQYNLVATVFFFVSPDVHLAGGNSRRALKL